MIPTFQSFDDKKPTKSYLKPRPIKPLGNDKTRHVNKAPPSTSNTTLPKQVTIARTPIVNQNVEMAPPLQPIISTPSITTPLARSTISLLDTNGGDSSIYTMRESSIQVSEQRLKAIYLQFEENQKKIIEPSMQNKIPRSNSFSNVLSIFSKIETTKAKLLIQRNHLEEAKQNFIQELAKYDGQTIEALKEIGNLNEEFNGLITNLEKLPNCGQGSKTPIMVDKEIQVNPQRVLFKSPSAEFLPTMQMVPLPPSPILRSSIKSNKPKAGDITPIAFKF